MEPTKVLLASVVEDKDLRDKLRKGLKPINKAGIIEVWDENDILPGEVSQDKLIEQLQLAEIIVLLISTDALGSEYFYSKYMDNAVQRHLKNEASVVPVIVSSCSLEHTPLKPLKSIPSDGTPMRRNIDEAVYTVVEEIKLVVNNRRLVKEINLYLKEADRLYESQQWENASIQFNYAIDIWKSELSMDKNAILKKNQICLENVNQAKQFDKDKNIFFQMFKEAEVLRDQKLWAKAIEKYSECLEKWIIGIEVEKHIVEGLIWECQMKIINSEPIVKPELILPVNTLIQNETKTDLNRTNTAFNFQSIELPIPESQETPKNEVTTTSNIQRVLLIWWENKKAIASASAVLIIAIWFFINIGIGQSISSISFKNKENNAIQKCREMDTILEWQIFLDKFPSSKFVKEATESVKRLKYRQDRLQTYSKWWADGQYIKTICDDINRVTKAYPKDSVFYQNLKLYYQNLK